MYTFPVQTKKCKVFPTTTTGLVFVSGYFNRDNVLEVEKGNKRSTSPDWLVQLLVRHDIRTR